MKIKDLITIDRESNRASTGYDTFLVKLEGLALRDVSYTPAPSGLIGAPGTKHFTFQAIKAGRAEVQFAKFRPWLVPAEVLYEEVLTIDVEAAYIW
jgi:predicted secreted protein